MAPAISVQGLGKTFQVRRRRPGFLGALRSLFGAPSDAIEAVHSISFDVPVGQLLAFIGPNGAGKSTTIKMLTGILHPTEGQASVLGKVPWAQRQELAYSIGSVFGQRSQLWYHLPPRDSFDLLAAIFELPRAGYRARMHYLVEVFELEELLDIPVRKLSLGQRMRCEIAGGLLHGPRVLFLDEPTIGLDVVAKLKIRDLIKKLNQEEGLTVFLTSHDAGDIEELCRRVIVINHGTLVLDTSVSRLKRHFLKTKIVDAKLEEPLQTFIWEGVEVLKKTVHGIKLQVDTKRVPIDKVIASLMQVSRLIDLTITDPPMEEIIQAIYAQGKDTDEDEEE